MAQYINGGILPKNNARVTTPLSSGLITKALTPFVDQFNHHHNTLQQRQITEFFRQRAIQQPTPLALPDDAVSVADFQGFEDEELLDELVPDCAN